MQTKKLIEYVSLVIILIGIILLVYYFINQSKTATENLDNCKSNPFSYGAKYYEELYGFKVYGYAILITPTGYQTPSISFNSTHTIINNP